MSDSLILVLCAAVGLLLGFLWVLVRLDIAGKRERQGDRLDALGNRLDISKWT